AEALRNGAAAVVVSQDMGLSNQIICENTRSAYTLLCSAFYSHPERKLKIIGITGTNGKTTTAFVIRSSLEAMGHKTGMIGTVKNVLGNGIEVPAALTTPDPFELFSLFEKMAENGCEYCVMEVSSQALDQRRVDGIHFDCAVFTNLTQDHLDYHETFENYKAAKHMLFENASVGIFNIDDEAAEYMMSNTPCRKVTYSANENTTDYSAKNIRLTASGVKYELVSNSNIGRISFRVPGKFSVYNSMCAAVCMIELGMDFTQTVEAVSDCAGVPGRMEIVETDTPYTVLIDYAHTPDSLQNAIVTLKEVTPGRVIAVFGCGGDRDKTKRPIMGEIGTTLADVAVITSDNPRSEDPDEIIKDILAGVSKHPNAKVIVDADRTEAIGKALEIAEENDVILLAGKGHETYQILSTGKIHYDEREIIANLLKRG
ncbi:MAG: UDP-N-acetylmuramoyl-L-alanyl-D-glutamate--2,6-diaminopimelate ligase, partial [Clostridia bacterium]|nr:UDP-N-acetylmuramoyl-L-alanyl-D-glutamate--2,6-diaminopimelate ligase [Clostridia bacterium]